MMFSRMLLAMGVLGALTACTVYQADGPEQKKPDKVYICHKGETLRLSDNAIRSHLNHGDQLGICSAENNN